MELKYNNIGYPVYISYARKSYEYPDIEKVVDDFEKALEHNHIEYKRDKSSAMDKVSCFEKEIGNGKIVVIFLSRKYLESKHCMYEWTKIHENEDNKKIIYVKYKRHNKKEPGAWNYSAWFSDLLKYWEDQLDTYWKRYVRVANEPSVIDKESYYYNFYRQQITQIESGKKRDRLDWYYSDDENVIDLVINNIIDYINKELGENRIDKLYKKIATSKSILCIGDDLVSYKENPDSKGMPLTKYVDEQFQILKKSRYQGRNYNDKSDYARILNNIDQDCLHTDELDKILQYHKFEAYIIIGFSNKLFETIKKRLGNDKDRFYQVYDLKNSQFVLNQDESQKLNERSKTNDNDKQSIKKVVRIYRTLKMSNYTEDDVVLFEMDFVKYTNHLVQAIEKESNAFSGKMLLSLGTNMPTWALKFVWGALSEYGGIESLISNQEIDENTHSLIESNKGILINNAELMSLADKFSKEAEILWGKTFDNGNKKVYIFYVDEDRDLLDRFNAKILDNMKDVDFLYRHDFLNQSFTNKCIRECDLFILFNATDKIDIKYSDELKAIKEKITEKRGNVYAICRDDKSHEVGIKISLNLLQAKESVMPEI